MWQTSHGDRILAGAEARLVLIGIGHLRDMITAAVDEGCPYDTEVELFNQLQPTQQLAVLHEVAFALLDPTVDVPELTAIREATVYVLFRELIGLVEMEVELSNCLSEPRIDTRVQINAALKEGVQLIGEDWSQDFELEDESVNDRVLEDSCEDLIQWRKAIESLADQILWDRDFELEELFADHDPEQTREVKQMMGISDDYFSIPAPDSQQYLQLDRELVELSRSALK